MLRLCASKLVDEGETRRASEEIALVLENLV